MNRALELARTYGVAVELADLGDWSGVELRSEYDAHGPVIRINARVLDRIPPSERETFAATAIAHELYHHREHRGEVARLATRALREAAAQTFARELVG